MILCESKQILFLNKVFCQDEEKNQGYYNMNKLSGDQFNQSECDSGTVSKVSNSRIETILLWIN